MVAGQNLEIPQNQFGQLVKGFDILNGAGLPGLKLFSVFKKLDSSMWFYGFVEGKWTPFFEANELDTARLNVQGEVKLVCAPAAELLRYVKQKFGADRAMTRDHITSSLSHLTQDKLDDLLKAGVQVRHGNIGPRSMSWVPAGWLTLYTVINADQGGGVIGLKKAFCRSPTNTHTKENNIHTTQPIVQTQNTTSTITNN